MGTGSHRARAWRSVRQHGIPAAACILLWLSAGITDVGQPSVNGCADAVARDQCHASYRSYGVVWHEVELVFLRDHRDYQRRFHRGERITDALSRTCTEREV